MHVFYCGSGATLFHFRPHRTTEMVEQAFYDGDSRQFMKCIKDYNIELWSTRFLFDTIARDKVSKTKERSDAHYELVRDLLQSRIADHVMEWNDDDILQEWIHLLVEQRYPWFVCSLWNHLRPTAISFLHQSSMQCCHTGILHQLLRHNLIAHLWENADFMSSSVDQAVFFNEVEHADKSFRKTFRKQLVYFPYDDEQLLAQLVDILLLWKSHKVLKLFLAQPEGDNILKAVPNLIQRTCGNHDTVLVDWLMERTDEPFTMEQWFDMFYNVYSHYMSGKRKCNDSRPAYQMCLHLMHIFREQREPSEWLELLTQCHSEISFLTLFVVYSKYSHELLEKIWSITNEVLDVIPDDYCTHVRPLNIELRWKSISRARLLFIVDELCANNQGWTTFANSLRWGTTETAQFMLRHCHDNELITQLEVHTSALPTRVDNALTLALYNPDNQMYLMLLQREQENIQQIQKWIMLQDGKPLLTALTRLSFFHPQLAVERFQHMLSLCKPLATLKNEMLTVYESAWCNHYQLYDTFRNQEDKELTVDNTLFQELMNIDHPCNVKVIVSFLTRLSHSDTDQFHCFLERFSNTFTVQFIKDVYLALVEQHIVKVDMLQSLENLPVFRELMASTLLDVHRFYMAWSKHSETDFKEFVQRMISVWQQPVHHVMPANYTFYSQSHMHIVEGHGEYKSMQKWKLWMSFGMLPLCMYTEKQWSSIPLGLQKMLKAYRLLRKTVQRKLKILRSKQSVYQQRKKMRFMVRCSPQLQRTLLC